MRHRDVLTRLFPLELGGDYDADTNVEGLALDRAQAQADQLLREIFPDTAHLTIADWERVYGLNSNGDDPLQLRVDRLLTKIRARGGLSKAWFIALAKTMGYEITIDEPLPFMCGWHGCGDALYEDVMIWIWIVTVLERPFYFFRAGQSCCGEHLGWWQAAGELEESFWDLCPPDTKVYFDYIEED